MTDILRSLINLLIECFKSIVCALMGVIFAVLVIACPFVIVGAVWLAICLLFSLTFDWVIPIAFVVCATWLIATAEGGE